MPEEKQNIIMQVKNVLAMYKNLNLITSEMGAIYYSQL